MISEKQLKELKQGSPVEIKIEKQPEQFPGATFEKVIDEDYVLIKSGGAGQKIKSSLFKKYGSIPGEEKAEAPKAEAPKPKKDDKKKK